MPALRDWGIDRWFREAAEDGPYSRVGGPWAEVGWGIITVVSLAYIFAIFAGIRAMERRPPVRKRIFEYMFMYNAMQVLASATIGFNLWREAWRLGFPYPWGNALDASPSSYRLGMWLWCQYHRTQLELVDTLFVILRKKFHQMSFLHIFLRLVHTWGWFFVCRYACGGDSYFPAAVNCSCQFVVYLYYTLSLINARGVPFVRKARVSEVQVMQFIICAVHAAYVLVKGHLPRAVATWSLLVMCSGLFLYVDFEDHQRHPSLGPRSRSSCAGDEANKERLTFRFDSSGWFYVYHFGVAAFLEDFIIPKGLSEDEYCSSKYPENVAFSGSSGGSLVAAALATGTPIRDLFEFVMAQHGVCARNPYHMFTAVESALDKYLPANCAKSMTGRVRVLLTRVSRRPPFLTGEVVDRFVDKQDVFTSLRASCHVPGLHLFPYRHRAGLYFDGLVWSSLLVAWSGDRPDLVVKVSAIAAPLTDIRAPVSPVWWCILPPDVDTLRGLFWLGYKDAARWFTESPQDPLDVCKCRSSSNSVRRRYRSDSSDSATTDDTLSASRFAKHDAARKLLLRTPGPLEELLPAVDPATGQSVAELIACYRRTVDLAFHRVLRLGAFLFVVAIALGIGVTCFFFHNCTPSR
eukprot:CAMPEP_0172721550 /NCGR_PEP_ID=MMETSP1074-20121228/79305_1 /TAXON_ID=2916 /ORGANISM="Ceratium fusus, Strain PA161109" /LENGTH=633 /DNA_ID=CAMNT_0013547309 /DNA_START=245 /DNA_END=2146 /DNA_ORIENTATION=+